MQGQRKLIPWHCGKAKALRESSISKNNANQIKRENKSVMNSPIQQYKKGISPRTLLGPWHIGN